jgi:hypothetical protein
MSVAKMQSMIIVRMACQLCEGSASNKFADSVVNIEKVLEAWWFSRTLMSL